MRKEIILNAFSFIVSISLVQAQYTEIDLRSNLKGNKNYIGIAARDNTFSGHAFVILGKENDQKQMSEMSVQGFYPKKDGAPFDEGQVKDDFKSLKYVRNSEEEVFFIVNDNDYNAAVKTVAEWSSKPPKFNIATMNCIDLTQHVAKSIGVILPSRGEHWGSITPAKYLRLVKDQLYSKQGLEYKNKTRVVSYGSEVYIGSLKNGKAEGPGRSVSITDIYVGDFKNGQRNGKGTSTSKTDYSETSGNFQNGYPESPYQIKYKDGSIALTTVKGNETEMIYSGTDGSKTTMQFDDQGKPKSAQYTSQDGISETWEYNGGFSPASGTYSANGAKVKINKFYTSKLDSLNIHLEDNGAVFDGDIWYRSGQSYQKGSIKFSTGDTYDGELKNFKFNGRGRLVHTEEKDCAFLGLFCTGNSFDITDDFTDGTSPFLRNMGIGPAPSKSFPDPNEWRVPMGNEPQVKPQQNQSGSPISPENTNNLDPVPAGRPQRPDGYNNHNSYWNPVKRKWELL